MLDLQEELTAWSNKDLYRERLTVSSRWGPYVRLDNRRVVCFASNDYLGLSQHPAVIAASMRALEQFGVGSGSSSMIAGFSALHHQLENKLADFFGFEKALVFSSGFMACQALIAALLGRDDCLVADKLSHASLWQASHAARVPTKRFLHNDMASLTRRMQGISARRCLIATEGVFSMSGQVPNLQNMQQLAADHDATLLVDDAHGIGVMGAAGRGTLEAQDMNHERVILMGTFGKALGGMGAFIAATDQVITSVMQLAKAYTYTTAPSASMMAAVTQSLYLLESSAECVQQLRRNIQIFIERARYYRLPFLASETAIHTLVVGHNRRVIKIGKQMLKRGFWVGAIRPPSVEVGQAKLRVGLSALHQPEQIDAMLSALHHCLQAEGLYDA